MVPVEAKEIGGGDWDRQWKLARYVSQWELSLEGQWGAERKNKQTHVTKSLLTDEAEQVFKAVLQVQALTCDSENF